MEQAEGFAESDRGGRERGCGRRDVEVGAGPDCGTVSTHGGYAGALKAEAYRPQPRARSPREPADRLRSEEIGPEEPLLEGSLRRPCVAI